MAPITEEVVNEEWKSAPIQDALELTDPQAKKFIEHGIENMGQFEQLRADIANSRAVWPKGVGPATVSKITETALTWLSKNRDGIGEVVGDEVAEDPVVDTSEGDGTEDNE